MKELNKKVFWTIFLLLSSFVLLVLMVLNVIYYRHELMSIERNLNFSNRDNNPKPPQNEENDNNMIFMDHEVYTIFIYQGQITEINYHGILNSDFDVNHIANLILKNDMETTVKIGNLYFSNYSYYYDYGNSIVIINTADSKESLQGMLFLSFLFFVVTELLLSIIVRYMTSWIVQPAKDAFDRQKNFIADASHELKTPLSVIMASADELKSNKTNQKYIENIQYESDRMKQLLTSMLDLSKLESGVTKENYKDENLSKIMEKVCLTFEGIAYEKNLTIESHIQELIMFHCSKEEMERLLSILLDNAIKHSKMNEKVTVSLKKERNLIHLSVMNVGDPIPEGEEEKIFERFYRVDKARNRKENRYGLGLAIAKNIVINHNGVIKASSKDGLTTFKIIFKK